jgi:hypothetical protein
MKKIKTLNRKGGKFLIASLVILFLLAFFGNLFLKENLYSNWYKKIFINNLDGKKPLLKYYKKKPEPESIDVYSKNNQIVGRGMWLGEDKYLIVDHLLNGEDSLKINNKLIKIITRNFVHDLALVQGGLNISREILPTLMTDKSTILGQKIWWRGGDKNLRSGKIIAYNQSFQADGSYKKNLLKINGLVDFGDSGKVVFNNDNEIVGLIVGIEIATQSFFVTTAENIINFLKND